jgi:hypothetical protein
MVTLSLSMSFAKAVKYGAGNAGRAPIFNPRFNHSYVPDTKKAFYDQLFEENRFMKKPVAGWKDYKRERLKSFEEYGEKLKKCYGCDDEIIQKTYEGYCKGSYKSYLIEREQINPGIII